MTNSWQRWKGIMKCVPFEEKRLAKWQPPYIIQPKYDGFRCRAIPIETGDKGEYIFLSSEENIFYSVPHLNEVFKRIGLRAELDGELYNHEVYKRGGFDELSSIISRTVNLHPDHQKIQFHLFDIVNEQPQMRRLLIIEALKGLTPLIQVAPFWLCENLNEVKKAYNKLISLGYEGIIVRHFQNLYEKKRSTLVMKFKPKKKDTYKIVDWKEEISKDGNLKNRIGSIICSSQKGDTFGVSAGLDDSDREYLWSIRETLAGKDCIVHYQHLTNKGIPKGTFNVEVIDERKADENPRHDSRGHEE